MLNVIRQRLSHRQNGVSPDGPYEGVPDHLRHVVMVWFRDVLHISGSLAYRIEEMRKLAVVFRVNLPTNTDSQRLSEVLCALLEHDDDEVAIDLIDATLGVVSPGLNGWFGLQEHLTTGASAWRVNDERDGLTRVVSDESQATYDAATATADAATTELRTAWSHAFGRNGDPSDAWDHAIKAVEDVLVPVVVPNKAKGTLGDVLGQLGSPQSAPAWEMILPGADQSHDVAPLVAMLRLMWPNHDRHGGNTPKRTPSPEEARAVVTLAATIVQWHRQAWVVRKR